MQTAFLKLSFTFIVAICCMNPLNAQIPTLEWAKAAYGLENLEQVSSVEAYATSVDTWGNVYVTGEFFGIADFSMGADNTTLVSNGSSDIFILKLDAVGDLVWIKSIGGNFSDRGHSIHTDTEGNVYVVGAFASTVDFDPNSGVYELSSESGIDAFVLKLDLNGNFLWQTLWEVC